MNAYDRRNFLLGSAAVAATAAHAADELVRAAFIGTGGRGTYLLEGTLPLPNVQVVAVCDIKPDRLDRAASLASPDQPQAYTDWRRVLDRKDVSAVHRDALRPARRDAPGRQARLLREAGGDHAGVD